MSSSSSIGLVDCHCGMRARLYTSWSDRIPGRRFHRCKNWSSNGCGFFSWEDPPICERARLIIPGLLRSRNELANEVSRLSKRCQKLKWMLVMTWVCWGFVFLSWVFVGSGEKGEIGDKLKWMLQ